MAALSLLGTQMDKIILHILHNITHELISTEVSKAMENPHKAIGENAKNNKILKDNIKMFLYHSLSIITVIIGMWNSLRMAVISRAILIT